MFAETINAVGKVIGMDISGVVEKVGGSVTNLSVGDEVYAYTADLLGGWAEYAVTDEEAAYLKPSNLSFEESAALPSTVLTALGAIRFADIKEGAEVLVNGASGGVGLYLVQILKVFGAEVTGVCSTRNAEIARKFGVDTVIDYKKEKFPETESAYDAVFAVNGYQPLDVYKKLLKPGGVYVLVGGTENAMEVQKSGDETFKDSGKRLERTIFAKIVKDFPYIKELCESGKLKPYIDKIYPVADVSLAIRHSIIEHAQGKIAITVDF